MFYPIPKQFTSQQAANMVLGEVSRLLRARNLSDMEKEDQFAAFMRTLKPRLCHSTALTLDGLTKYPPRAKQAFHVSLCDMEDALDDYAASEGGTKGTIIAIPIYPSSQF